MNTNKEKELLYLQITGSIIFIITIFISIILTINNIDEKKKILTQEQENNISLMNRIVIAIIAITFTYISYEFYQMNKSTNKDISKQELLSSILALISSLILLNTTIENIKRKSGDSDLNIPII